MIETTFDIINLTLVLSVSVLGLFFAPQVQSYTIKRTTGSWLEEYYKSSFFLLIVRSVGVLALVMFLLMVYSTFLK